MKVRIAMGQIALHSTWEATLEAGLRMVAEAGRQGAQAICFPELSFLPFFPHTRADPKYFDLAEPQGGPTVKMFASAAREHGILIILNFYEATDRGDYFDTSVLLRGDGSVAGYYRMHHLAESGAFNEKYYYWPGDMGYPVFETAIGRVGMLICHDRNFPEAFRSLALDGAVVVFLPNAYTVGAYQNHRNGFELPNQGASLANNLFTVVVNRVGPGGCVPGDIPPEKGVFCGASFVTGPYGDVLGSAPVGEEALFCVDVDLYDAVAARRQRPYFRDRRPESYGRLANP